MSLSLPIAVNRRGACPSLDAPMQTGDGLLARLRVADNRLTPEQLGQLARIAGDFGNGVIEITARGNLQVRGLTSAGVRPFARMVEMAVDIERGLVVETPPLAGLDPSEHADPRPLAASIRAAALSFNRPLGPKVCVVVDGNGRLNLSALKADIRLVANGDGEWTMTVGEHYLGKTADPAQATIAALILLAELGPDARANDLSHMQLLTLVGHLCTDAPRPSQSRTAPIGTFSLGGTSMIGLGLPFGAVSWDGLAQLAFVAPRHGVSEFRLSPHHALLAVGASADLLDEVDPGEFITDMIDPRRRVSACIGSGGCASGYIAARRVANRLAPLIDADSHLHVSGCAKGCAHPRAASVTLVGRADGYGLVLDGLAGDTPLTILRADQLATAIGPAWQG